MKLKIYKSRAARSILAIFVAVIATIPAHATFPGKNGRIAFVFGPDIYTMKPDGSDVRQLTNLGNDNAAFWKSWSPDGKQIVFNEYRSPDFIGQLWIMNADGSNQHLLLDDKDFDDERPTFAPDVSSVIFSRCRLDIEACAVYKIGIAGGTPTAITKIELGIQDLSPQYSSTGRSLAFTGVSRGGILCAIYLQAAQEATLRRLTPAPLTARQPDWSPDAKRIAFSSHCGTPQNEEIWALDVEENELRRLTNNGNDYLARPHDFHPSWSPQGDAIVFERDAPDFSSSAIYIMKHDGTSCRELFKLHTSPRSNLLRAKKIQERGRSAINGRKLRQIEEGGALPRWGVAPN